MRRPRELPTALLWRRDPTWLAPSTLALIALGAAATAHLRGAAADLGALWRHGLLWTAVGFLLSTTGLTWGTAASGTLPHFRWLAAVPFTNAVLREERRLGFPCLVGFALMAGAAFVACVRVVPRRHAARATPLLVTAVLVGTALAYRTFTTEPMRLASAMDGSSKITALLRDVDGPILELPVGPRGVDPRSHAPAMYRSLYHWRPILNGYSSYWPTDFPARMELAAQLPAGEALDTLVRQTGLAAIVVDLSRCTPDERAPWYRVALEPRTGRLSLAAATNSELLFLVDRTGLQ